MAEMAELKVRKAKPRRYIYIKRTTKKGHRSTPEIVNKLCNYKKMSTSKRKE